MLRIYSTATKKQLAANLPNLHRHLTKGALRAADARLNSKSGLLRIGQKLAGAFQLNSSNAQLSEALSCNT